MSRNIIDITAARIAEHASTHAISAIDVILHGGEPLLAGVDRIQRTVRSIRRAVGNDATVRFAIQTNGIWLDATYLEVFRQLGVRVGVSLDGDRTAQDRHRRTRAGAGTYDAVARSLRLLGQDRYRHLFAGILAVVDLANDPVMTYQGLLEFKPPMVDFLLPYGHWSELPPGHGSLPHYGRWLTAVFDRWYGRSAKETQVRLFEEIMSGLLGGASWVEGVGTSPLATVVVDTDGRIGQFDLVAESAGHGCQTGLHVATDPLALAVNLPALAESRRGFAGLPRQCQDCVLHFVCGGGLYAHRYRAGAGYGHPSVYCRDLRYLITHIWRRLSHDVAMLG